MNSLRNNFLLDPRVIFLNHGSFGATPRPVFERYQQWQLELERQPVEFLGRRADGLMKDSRTELAVYLGCNSDDLVYVTNATTGLNVIAHSLRLGPGDEVLSSDHEYGALDRTWRFLSRKTGFKYINHPVSVPVSTVDDFVDQFWQGVTAQTRVIFLSHITSPTAIIFPVEAVCRRARQEGILTVIDGAHAPGQIPLDLASLWSDFYSGNLHKWLCAPKGSAFLYARPEVQALVEPLVVSWGWEPRVPGPSPFIDQQEWTGTRDISPFLSVPAAIQFQRDNHWDQVVSACHRLLSQALERIVELTGIPTFYPSYVDTWFSQMATAPLPQNTDIDALKQTLYDQYRIEVPLMEWNGHKLMRISIQGYNTQDDVDRLIEALREQIHKPSIVHPRSLG